MNTKQKINQEGITLVEIVAAIAIGLIMLSAIYMAVNSAQRSTSGIERKVTAQQDARTVLELMAMEIRMASYNQSMTNSVWVNPTNCAAAANPTYKGIQEATPTSLTIEMDIDNSGAVGDHANEIIRYEYLTGTSDLRITRETRTCVGGVYSTSNAQSLLGAALSENIPRTVHVINNTLNPIISVFRYFTSNGVEIFPTFTAAGTGDGSPIPNIRRIDITLAVETEDIDPSTKQRRQLIYSTSVIPMNHAINP
ncbi:MAG: prepilin-type N-terminal cleavage/methylation domain-containing protein [Syntrophales bacterium]